MDYETEISEAARANNIPVDLFKNAINSSSGGDQNFVGMDGSFGVSGVQPQTLIDMGFDPYNAKTNIAGGAAYFRSLFDKFGNWKDATQAFVADDDKGAQVFSNSTISTDPANAGAEVSTFGAFKMLSDFIREKPAEALKAFTPQNPANNPDNFQTSIVRIAGVTAIVALVAFSVMSATKGKLS
jgi:hypothetical protein